MRALNTKLGERNLGDRESLFDLQLPSNFDVCERLYFDTGEYIIDGKLYDRDRLVITFEPETDNANKPLPRYGWGSVALSKRKVSHISLIAKKSDWYQGKTLPDALLELRPVLKRFNSRITYGSSMGGFAALAFSDLLLADQAFVFDPQSTLRRHEVPFEKRFLKANLIDFSGEFGSAVGKFASVKEVLVFVDPFCREDVAHFKLLKTKATTAVRVPFVGHGVAYSIAMAKCMPIIVDGVISGNFDYRKFYKSLHHGRRVVDRYQSTMRSRTKASVSRSSIVERYLSMETK